MNPITTIDAKTIVSEYRDKNDWFGANYNMNIYKGCNHGCIYCDSRSDCYQIENFDTVRAKANALTIIEKDLRSKRKTGVVGSGAMSDPYNPYEHELALTRGALALIHRYGFGVALFTKSDLIVRDADLLKEISKHSPVLTAITITSSDDVLSKKIEQNVSVSSDRFKAVKALSDQGLFAGIILMPVLPFIEDNPENIKAIVKLAHDHNAKFIFSYPGFGVTLRANQREWYFNKLDLLFPGLKEKYIQVYGNSYECASPNSKQLWALFTKECEKYGILYRMNDIIKTYQKGYGSHQLSLFDL
jgi:DNA repair photolyase